MNKMIAGLFAAALVSAPAFADVGAPAPTAKDLEKAVEKVNYVKTAQSGIKLSGYVDAGYTYNFQSDQVFGKSSLGAPATSSDATPRGDFNLNAVKLTLEKPLSNANEFQAGFRADIKVGEDATLLGSNFAAAGTSDNLSLDQAYVIIRAPLGNGLDITVGKFASLLGYEVDDRPANLNITYGYDYNFVTTHQTGVKFFYPVNDNVELQLAVSNGSGLDTSFVPSTDTSKGFSDGYGVTGTINIKNSGGNANWFNGVYYSNAADGAFTTTDRGTILWNTWGNWAPKFANDKLLLGFSSTLGGVSNSGLDVTGLVFPIIPAPDPAPTSATIDSYSFWTASLYVKYQVTDIFSLAGRASYYHLRSGDINTFDINGDPLDPLPQRNFDAWSWTGTAGFDLLENLMLRAEYRIDLYDGLGGDAGEISSGETAQTVALQAVYTF